MEDILKEILYELKKINNKLYEDDVKIIVSMGDDVLVGKVIESMNKQSRINSKTPLVV